MVQDGSSPVTSRLNGFLHNKEGSKISGLDKFIMLCPVYDQQHHPPVTKTLKSRQ